MKLLRKNLRFHGYLQLNWFIYKKRALRKCPRGSYLIPLTALQKRLRRRWFRRCRITNLKRIYRWLRRFAPLYRINIRKLPKLRVYRFAPGTRFIRLLKQRHSRNGKILHGTYTSKRCRNYCLRRRKCRAVDYNGHTRRCFVYFRYKRVVWYPRTRNSFYWTVAQYRKILKHPSKKPKRYRNYIRRRGKCSGPSLHHYHRRSLRFCVNKCNRRRDCAGFVFYRRGRKTKCVLKKRCHHFHHNRRNYHYYQRLRKVFRFTFGKIFRKNIRKGGIIHIKLFRGLKKCMHGTKRIGKSRNCRVYNPRFLLRWVRRNHKRFHFNLLHYRRIPKLYHEFLFNGRRPKPHFRIKLRGGVKIVRRKALYFPGGRHSGALGKKFPKFRNSFTISFFVKPSTVSKTVTLIGNWGSHRWQYLFKLRKGGILTLAFRGKNPGRDLFPWLSGGKLAPKRWYYVGFSWNHHTGVAKIYVNGKVVATRKTKQKNHDLFHNPYPFFQLGFKLDSRNENFKGYIARLRFTRGVLPLRLFKRFTRGIKGLKLHFGGFKFTKLLHKALRPFGLLYLKWFRWGKHVVRRCPAGTYKIGRGKKNIRCRINRINILYRWLRRKGPLFRINLGRLPRMRFYRFAPGNKHIMLARMRFSKGGRKIRGRFTSRSCRNWCLKHRCWAVDYNGSTKTCTVHRKPKTRYFATKKSVGTKFYWKIAQYVKRRFISSAHFHIKGYRQRHGKCPGHRLGRLIHTMDPRRCARKCRHHYKCQGFFFAARGIRSYCALKSKSCRHLTHRNHKNIFFYSRHGGFKFTLHLRKVLKRGGVFPRRWFRKLKRCPWGTIPAGKNCKIIKIYIFFRWIRKYRKLYHINLNRFPYLTNVYHTFIFRPGRVPKRFRIFHTGVRFVKLPAKRPKVFALDFPGKRGHYVTGPRFAKSRGSFTISVFIKPRTVGKVQTIIGNWASHKWQYLFRIWKGGRLGLYLRGAKGGDIVRPLVGGKIKPNTWYYVGFSWNHLTGIAHIYQNGKIVATSKTTRKNHDLFEHPFPRFQLGFKKDSNSGFFNGLMANLRFTRGVINPKFVAHYVKLFIVHNKLNFNGFPKNIFKLLYRQVRPGGIIHLSWFKRKHCFPGTHRKGKTCRIFRYRLFIRWLKANAYRFRINLGKLPLSKVWPVVPSGRIFKHPYFVLLGRRPRTKRPMPKRSKGPYGTRVPAFYFPGKPNVYFRVPFNHNKYHFKSLTITAFIKQNKIRNGPIVEFPGGRRYPFGMQFWIWQRKLFVNLRQTNGRSYGVVFNIKGNIPTKRWNFVGMSYNHRTGILLMWINGHVLRKYVGRFRLDTAGSMYVGVRPKAKTFSPFRGYLSAVNVYDYAVPRAKLHLFRKVVVHKIDHIKALPKTFWIVKKIQKPKPKPVYLRPAGKFWRRPWYDLTGFRPARKHLPTRAKGPYGSNRPSYYFPGNPQIYFYAPNHGHLHFKSFTLFAFIRQKQIRNGAIIEYVGMKGRNYGTQIWIWKKKLFINLSPQSNKQAEVFFNLKGGIPANRWNFVGASYNYKTGVIFMWLNGNTYQKHVGRYIADTTGDPYVGVRHKQNVGAFKGYIATPTILPFAVGLKEFKRFRVQVMRKLIRVKFLPKRFWWKVGYKPPKPKEVPTERKEPKAYKHFNKKNLRQGGRFYLTALRGLFACPRGTKTVGKVCVITNYKIFVYWLKINAATYRINFSTLPFVVTTTTTTTSQQFQNGQKLSISMFRNVCPSGTKTKGQYCVVNDARLFLAWLKVNAKAYGIQFQYSSSPGTMQTGGATTTVTQGSTSIAVGTSFPIAQFKGHCPKGTKKVKTNCIITDITEFMAWFKVNGAKYGFYGGSSGSATTTTTTTSTSAGFGKGQRFPYKYFANTLKRCPPGTKKVGANCVAEDPAKFMTWVKKDGAKYGFSF